MRNRKNDITQGRGDLQSLISYNHTISYNRTNKQPDPSFEFFSILLTFDRLKQ